MHRCLALLTAQLIAFWPLWKWYYTGTFDGSGQPLGLLALGTAVILLLREKKAVEPGGGSLAAPAVLMILYILSYHFIPPLLRAVIAFSSLTCTVSAIVYQKPFNPGLWGLSMLSLPIMPSLMFYIGYPLRAFITYISAAALQLSGFALSAQGTCLNWSGNLVVIDAPCSGITMLWAGGYLAFTVAMLYRLSATDTVVSALLAFVFIIIGNILRVLSLFYVENAHISLPSSLHDAIGVSAFIITACMIMATASYLERLERKKRCAFFS